MRCRIEENLKFVISPNRVFTELELPFVPRVGEILEIRDDEAPHGFRVEKMRYVLDLPDGEWYAVIGVKEL